MEEVKRTVEELVGYKANDGVFFRDREECLKYERGAFCAAQAAAKALAINDMSVENLTPVYGCFEEHVSTYDVKDANALQVLNTWLQLEDKNGPIVEPQYIGKRIAVQYWCDCGHSVLGTREEIEANFKHKLDKVFNPPEVAE